MTAIERAKEIIGNDVTADNIEDFVNKYFGDEVLEGGDCEFLWGVQDHLEKGSPLPPWPVTKLPFSLCEPCVELLGADEFRLAYDIYDLETFNELKAKIIHTFVEVDGVAPEACRSFNGFEQFEDCWTADPTIEQLEKYFEKVLDN